ncbi:hypothetical protein [Limnoraphis robusta]|uniref:SH3b domain-containing protein n=1 Tax=Limnoraphis robusta CCNP1315 TaxID=3110306 RepID=A0ABU5U326_9CYAN|nr:hypothetical protein [Limnoraphis robusta]MEA5521292.1 hypothetical protein [Limnoraphis robusta CCNP1315]MEA5544864.1 hypothetical protein [Limnoraphis robusta CCNP1324]
MWLNLLTLLLSVCITLMLGIKPVFAQEAPDFYQGNWPDSQGNYPIRQQYHGSWQVVDRDPKGLNCRANIPPYAGSKEIRAIFPTGTLINAVRRDRGVFELGEESSQNQPWLRVQLFGQEGRQECWVRANKNYIIPIRPEKIS